ncbi:hypothetical protein KR222_006057 [Zaprionus bogoriensis]|nr:hypothetical protein KR222_006057 [Zaprionus bogoriensis]
MPFSLANSYLNAAQRPLWVLEDELMKRQRLDRREEDYETTTHAPATMRRARTQQSRGATEPKAIHIVVRPDAAHPVRPPLAPPPAQRRYVLPHRLQLPSHYVQQQQQQQQQYNQRPYEPRRRQARTEQRRRQPQSLPIFDNAPGDNTLSAAASYPIFVYNGSRGELLVNTMLSTQRYPMQEPVPGQVLYPPSTPMFRPKPIVERFRVPGQRELLNLTLIPFYAHEAITTGDYSSYATPSVTALTVSDVDTTATSSSVAAPPALTTPMPAATPYETQLPRSKRKRNPKKAKQYNAYHSPHEVVQRPPVLRSSPPLAAPDNHRHPLTALASGDSTLGPTEELDEQLEQLEEEVEQLEELESEMEMEETAAQPELTTASASTGSSSSLQIIYVDESVESPSDTEASTTVGPPTQRQSSRYALKREYFAFPVYTLGKLLQEPSGKRTPKDHSSESSFSTTDSSTWFILNSR